MDPNDENNYEYSILDEYFATVSTPDYKPESIEEGNMHLAEDRILCLKVFSKLSD